MQETKGQSNSGKYNAVTIRNQQPQEEHNTSENRHIIMQAIKDGRARDLSDEPKVDKKPCFIIGSGPSLDKSIERLKAWKGGIICTTSHAVTLMRYGIEPTHIMCLDPFSTWDEVKDIDWSKTHTKLILNPGVWPDLVANWPNEMLLYIQNIGKKDSYYATFQKRQFMRREAIDGSLRNVNFSYLIRTEITSFACSPPAQMFAAEILGYGNIFLAGVDFACPDGKGRFTSWRKVDGEWAANESLLDPNKTYMMTKNGLPTEDIHLYYKKNMISAWCLSGQQMYTTDKGAITECPYYPIEEVVKKQGKGFEKLSKAEIERATQEYLASVGAFVVETTGGKSFVEIEDELPLPTLGKFIDEINRKLKCTTCGLEMGVNNRDDHDLHEEDITNALGMDCPQCKKKTVARTAIVDKSAQLAKFDRLLQLVV